MHLFAKYIKRFIIFCRRQAPGPDQPPTEEIVSQLHFTLFFLPIMGKNYL